MEDCDLCPISPDCNMRRHPCPAYRTWIAHMEAKGDLALVPLTHPTLNMAIKVREKLEKRYGTKLSLEEAIIMVLRASDEALGMVSG